MSEKTRSVFVQEFNKDIPFHEHTLEGTKKFPIYHIGWSTPEYTGVSPLHLETMSFGENENGSYSSTFAHVLQNPKYRKKCYSLFFPPHPEDDVNDFHILRKCKFVREEEIEKIYPYGAGVESLVMSIPELGKFVSRPVRVAFDMYWEVVDEN